MTAISGTTVMVAFPEIMASFNTTIVLSGWVLSSNQLATTIGMPLIGKVSDVIGRKKAFLLCISLFTAGSLLSAVAPTIELLIAARFIQGLGTGGSLPVATSLIAEEHPGDKQKYIGFLVAVFPIGQIIGPNLGAWLTHQYGWQSNFWVFVPFGALVLLMSLLFLRRSPVKEKGRLDLPGAVLLTLLITSVMLGISFMGSREGEIPWLSVGLAFAAAIVLAVVFLRHQRRTTDPILDLAVLREKPFIASNIYNFIYGIALLGLLSFIPLYAVSVYGMSLIESGLVLTPRFAATMVAAFIISIYLVRLGYRRPMLIGTALYAACLFLMAPEIREFNLAGWHISSFVWLSGILFFIGVGQGMATPACNNACIELMPDRVGTIMGVRGMFRQVGGVIGISTIALILESSADISRGFQIVFIGVGVLLFLSIMTIFFIPERPGRPVVIGSPTLTH